MENWPEATALRPTGDVGSCAEYAGKHSSPDWGDLLGQHEDGSKSCAQRTLTISDSRNLRTKSEHQKPTSSVNGDTIRQAGLWKWWWQDAVTYTRLSTRARASFESSLKAKGNAIVPMSEFRVPTPSDSHQETWSNQLEIFVHCLEMFAVAGVIKIWMAKS